jgi:heat shock protein HtpX
MPLTFIDIERQKSWRIGLFFIILLLMYFSSAMVIMLVAFGDIFAKDFLRGVFASFYIFIIAAVLAFVHFYLLSYGAAQTIKKNLGAADPDPEDELHKRLCNIMAEIHVATGKKRKMACAVIPGQAMNALAVDDFKGNALILITEGLISRLSRDQTEAVIAHEAHHILSGDCRESTLAVSLFGFSMPFIEKIMIYGGRAYIFSFILFKLGYLLNLFISREREYRADAGAVRMTRNPLALAETLHLLSKNWRGTGLIGSELEGLCIVNPRLNQLDESEGFFADLFSSHPPIRKRIEILLAMAHTSLTALDAQRKSEDNKQMSKQTEKKYYALDAQYVWQGPFSISELTALPWFSTLTWVSDGSETITKASEIPACSEIFKAQIKQAEGKTTDYVCPVCQQRLFKQHYEQTRAYQCTYCGGTLVDSDKLPRIIIRHGNAWPEKIKAQARATLKENQQSYIIYSTKQGKNKIVSLRCPKCKAIMWRTFYSYAYLIEIDRCICGAMWFDKDELSMLQCMIENKMAGEDFGKEDSKEDRTPPVSRQ